MPVAGDLAGTPNQRRWSPGRAIAFGTALFPARVLLFLTVFFWHVEAVGPGSIFYLQNDLFLWNCRFVRDFLVTAGGPADCAGRLVLQACHFGWPGALILTAIAWVVCIATIGFLRCLAAEVADRAAERQSRTFPRRAWERGGAECDSEGGQRAWQRGGMAWALPAAVLLVVHSRYDYPFSASVGAALAMLASLAYAWAAERWGQWRLAWFAGLGAGVYYLAGAAFYAFALCSLIYESYRPGSRWMSRLGLVAAAAGVKCGMHFALSVFHPGLSYFHAPDPSFFGEELSLGVAAAALYASFPVCALLLADRGPFGVRRLVAAFFWRARRGAKKKKAAINRRTPKGAVAAVLFFAAAVIVSQVSLRRNERNVLRLHESAEHEQWGEVLRLAAHVPASSYSQYVRHDVNQALYHTGRLPRDLFSYPQASEPFVTLIGDDPYHLRRRRFADFHIQLGRVNDAEFFIHEDFMRRPSAEGLRQLARIAMVKNRPEMARLFLNVLRDDLIYGPWAEDALRRLQLDPTLSRDAEIGAIRAAMIAEDDVHYAAPPYVTQILSVSPSGEISSLLRNPPSRMAFEYLMARYLVMKDVETVVRLLPKAAAFSYPATPPDYEEAAMIYTRIRKEKPQTPGPEVVVNGCRISQSTLDKIRALDAATDSGRSDPAEISRIAGRLGLAYFHYYYHRDDEP